MNILHSSRTPKAMQLLQIVEDAASGHPSVIWSVEDDILLPKNLTTDLPYQVVAVIRPLGVVFFTPICDVILS